MAGELSAGTQVVVYDQDEDGDGLSAAAEDRNGNGLVEPGETNTDNPDTDGDGTPDGAKIKTGTDSLKAASYFSATPSLSESGILRLVWPAKPGATYRIEGSEDLLTWSHLIVSGLPATSAGSTTSFEVDIHSKQGILVLESPQ